jgi:hypothetical protein
MGAEQ